MFTLVPTRNSIEDEASSFIETLRDMLLKKAPPSEILEYIDMHQFSLPKFQEISSSYVSDLLSKSNGVCGKIWDGHDITFKCRTCEKDPTCAICRDCFVNGDHEGHDYVLSRNSSGMCDCGDPDAWDVKGFCKHHKGPDQDPTEHLPWDLKNLTREVCFGYVSLLFHYFIYGYNLSFEMEKFVEFETKLDFVTETVSSIVSVVLEKLNTFPSYKTLFGEALQLPFDDSFDISMLEFMFQRISSLPSKFSHLYTEIFATLLPDPVCKRILGEAFTNNYQEIITKYIQSNDYDGNHLSRISVQIFTTPSLAEHLAINLNLLDIVMRTLLTLTISSCNAQTLTVNPRSYLFLSFGYHCILTDINYVLIHPKISAYFLQRKDLFIQLLTYLSLIHRCVIVERIESDSDKWLPVSQVELRVAKLIFEELQRGVNFLLKENGDMGINHMKYTVFPLVFEFLEKTHRTEFGERGPSYSTHFGVKCIDDNVLNGPYNFFFPIHKLLAILIRTVIYHYPNMPLCNFFPFNSDFLLQTIENPLRMFVLNSHVRNRLWPRDNMQVNEEAIIYEKGQVEYTINNDLFLLQILLTLLGPNTMLAAITKRFIRNKRLFALSLPSDIVDAGIEEDVLRLLLLIFTCRETCEFNVEEIAKDYFLHAFFVGGNSFSDSVKSIPKPYRNSINEDELLNFLNKRSDGTYEAKKEMWNRFNPYFIAYSRKDSEKAYQNYAKYFGKEPLEFRQLAPFPENLQGVLKIFHNFNFHQILFIILLRTVNGLTTSHVVVSDKLLVMALHALYFTFDSLNNEYIQSMLFGDDSNNIVHNIKHKFLNNDDTIDETQRMKTIMDLLMEIYQHPECKEYSSFIKMRLFPLMQKYMVIPVLESMEDTAPKKSKRASAFKAKKRKQRVLEQFKKQQQKFDELSFLGEDMDIDIEEEELCCFCHAPATEDKKLSLLGMVTRSASAHLTFNLNIQDRYNEHQKNENTDLSMKPCIDIQHSHDNVSHAHKNINLGNGVQINTCTHKCHSSCLQSYYITLVSERRERVKGFLLLDLQDGLEILCPICSCISNTMIPFLKVPELDGQTRHDIFSEYERLSFQDALLKLSPIEEQYSKISDDSRSDLIGFIGVVDKVKQDQILDVISYNISTREIAQRKENTLFISEKDRDLLLQIFRCVRATVSQSKTYNGMIEVITKTIQGTLDMDQDDNSKNCLPMLSCDMFSLFVRLYILSNGLQNWGCIATIIEILYVSHFIQSLFVLTQRFAVKKLPPYLEDLIKVLNINNSHNPGYQTNAVVDNVQSELESMMLLLMRRVALFVSTFFIHKPNIPGSDFETLRDYLQLPTLQTVSNNITSHSEWYNISKKWISQLDNMISRNCIQRNNLIPRFAAPKPYHFVRLPNDFQTLVLNISDPACENCGTKFENPTLSLTDGRLIGLNADCCENVTSAITKHAKTQGRQGVYLSLMRTYVYVIATTRFAIVDNLYKDKYGESDEDLKRGKPLFVDWNILESLEQKFILNQFEQDTRWMVSPDARSGRLSFFSYRI